MNSDIYPDTEHIINEKHETAIPHIAIKMHAIRAEQNLEFHDCSSSNDILLTSAECDSSQPNSDRITNKSITIKK